MKIEDGYLIFNNPDEVNKIYYKKINGHNFVNLVGLNKFAKVGDTLLEMFGFIKNEVDPKYLLRGDFAEKIVKKCYERDGFKCTTYDKKACRYDNFKDNQYFSGLIDIDLIENETLIEVKSKSLKDYDKIIKYPPESEIYQGLMYGFLKNYTYIIMEWVFFDKETEEEIFLGKTPTTLGKLKKFKRTYMINQDEMKQLLNKAFIVVRNFVNERRIPLNLISESSLEKLGLLKKDGDIDISDLTF